MSTRTERIAQADIDLDFTMTAFLDCVMQSRATDIEKANIIRLFRAHTAATREYARAILSNREN